MAENIAVVEAEFRQALTDCRRLYHTAAMQCCECRPAELGDSPERLVPLMEDLHQGLLIKIFASIVQADRRWTAEEARLAAILVEHLWGQSLGGKELRDAALYLFEQGAKLQWYSLIRPFDRITLLHEHFDELETIVTRLANLVAKCDGGISPAELALLENIQREIRSHLRPIPIAEDDDDASSPEAPPIVGPASTKSAAKTGPARSSRPAAEDRRPPAERLREALADLAQLIGLAAVKQEVATLTNYLAMQQQRRTAGLPTTDLSLHMVFTGSPGTGKTSVARIIGRIYGAMGILAKGHLVETDRSGLVAPYAGQTGPKTNEKINEALDGILFIDEAYSLVAEEGEDPYGREAVQALLKRMEDDRERLVVIVAGYDEPMRSLLASNPGLSSRFSNRLVFDDYRPPELGQIFQTLCDKNRYRAIGPTQARLMAGFAWLYERRDEHFGNGRTVRNIFEHAIRRLANRIAGRTPITPELLTVLEPDDIEMPGVPPGVLQQALDPAQRFRVTCPGCRGQSHVPASFLGRAAKCKTCQHRFVAAWGELVENEQ
jgi:hypothetical protein